MLSVDKPSDLVDYVGKTLGESDWIRIDQRMIDEFARLTGDDNWYHVDIERAKSEMPGGKTIAHGYLTLSLLAKLTFGIYEIRNSSRRINYGLNRLRFMAPVQSGARIKLCVKLLAGDRIDGGVRLTFEWLVAIEGSNKPALVAEAVLLALD